MIATRPFYSLDDYERVELDSDVKHEFVGGLILAMAGGTVERGRLSANVLSEFRQALRGSNCQALSSDVRVGHERSDFRAYPDASVLCGPAEYASRPANTVTNPICVVEVLSESTAAYDRGEKFLGYQRMASLQSVVFVSQERPELAVHRRNGDVFEATLHGPGDTFELPGIPKPISVDDVYV